MNNWKKIKIEEVCSFINGYAFDSNKYVQNGIQVIRITNVQKGYISDTDKKFYKEEKELERYKLIEGDLLISLTGNVGRVGVIKSENLPAYLNQRVSCVRIKNNNLLNKRFLFNFLNSDSFEKTCIKNSKGIAQKNISTVWLREIKIPLPSMEEQKKIAARLDAVSDLLAKQKQLLAEQDNLIQSTFYDMFGTPFKNEKGFPYLQIKDLVSDVQYGTSQKADYTGKIPILRMNNITYSGEMDYTDLKYIDLEEETNKYILKKGDVLFNRTNSRELVGKTGLFNLDKLMVYAGYLIRVRLKGICLPIFLTKYMNTPQLKAFLKEKCKGIVGQANINAKELQAIPIFLPPLELQRKFAAVAEQIESEKSKIKSAIAETQTLFNALMSEYFEE